MSANLKADEVTLEVARLTRSLLAAVERERLGSVPLEIRISLVVEITPAIPDPFPETLELLAGSIVVDGETQNTVLRRSVRADRAQ